MLRVLLLLCCATASLVAVPQCPEGYDLVEDERCIRVVVVEKPGIVGDVMSKGIEECKKYGGLLPIIKSDDENSVFREIVYSIEGTNLAPRLILGAVCNPTTRKLEWMDGSPINYTYNHMDVNGVDCVQYDGCIALNEKMNRWDWYDITTSGYWTVICEAGPPECGVDHEPIYEDEDEEKPCFKVPQSYGVVPLMFTGEPNGGSDYTSFDFFYGKKSVKTDNKFFWRAAVSKNAIYNMHIGAYQADGKWRWIEDDAIVSYDNFANGYPVTGLDNCTAMLTETSGAPWINEECDKQKLAFACRRYGYSTLQKECPSDAPKEGKDILAPGFPTPRIPCEYSLTVGAKSLVQLEIVNLEANPNLDFLEVYEGATGLNLLANLSGTNPNPSTYATKSSNVMRVNWKPNLEIRPPQYRGFRIRYRAISI